MAVILDTTAKSIVAILAGAPATTQPDFEVSYSNKTATGLTGVSTHGVFTSGSEVTLLPSPATSSQNILVEASIYNADTASVTVTIKEADGATRRTKTKVTLPVGYTLHYERDGGWYVTDTNGNRMSGVTFPITAAQGGTGVANGASSSLTLANAAFSLLGGGASSSLTLPNAATSITGGGTLALGGFTLTMPKSDTVATLTSANVFTANQTISNTAPSLVLTDTTASAKSLTLTVDANVASWYESAGAAGDILSLDLVNKRVGIGKPSPGKKLTVAGDAEIYPTVGGGQLRFMSDNADAGERNWAFRPSTSVYGDFGLFQSNANGGDPYSAATARLYIQNNGNIAVGMTGPSYQFQLSTDSAGKPSTNTWTIVSDERTKDATKNRPFTNGLSFLKTIPTPSYFTYNGIAGTPEGEESVGWSAQALELIAPTMVRRVKGKLVPAPTKGKDKDGKDIVIPASESVIENLPEVDLFGVNTHELQYILMNSVLELDRRLDVLEKVK